MEDNPRPVMLIIPPGIKFIADDIQIANGYLPGTGKEEEEEEEEEGDDDFDGLPPFLEIYKGV